jgi:hypothetical protein
MAKAPIPLDAHSKKVAEAGRLMEQAVEKLREAREIKPDHDLELVGRSINTLIYFLTRAGKL